MGIRELMHILEAEPPFIKLETAEIHYKRGLAYSKGFNRTDAIIEYTLAIHLDPDYAEAYYRRAKEYFQQVTTMGCLGDEQESCYENIIRDCTEAIRLKPDICSKVYQMRGIAYDYCGDEDKAALDFAEAIQLDPENAAWYLSNEFSKRADWFSNRKKYDKAIEVYSKGIKLDPRNDQLYIGRSGIYAAKEDYDSAIADITELARIDPNNYALGLGYYYYIKKCEAEIKYYTEVIQKNPNDAGLYYARGNLYVAREKHYNAVMDFEAALRINPHDERVRQALAKIYQMNQKEHIESNLMLIAPTPHRSIR